MKVFEVVGIDGICVNPKDEVRYQNKLVFDDCFNIFDVLVFFFERLTIKSQ